MIILLSVVPLRSRIGSRLSRISTAHRTSLVATSGSRSRTTGVAVVGVSRPRGIPPVSVTTLTTLTRTVGGFLVLLLLLGLRRDLSLGLGFVGHVVRNENTGFTICRLQRYAMFLGFGRFLKVSCAMTEHVYELVPLGRTASVHTRSWRMLCMIEGFALWGEWGVMEWLPG